MTSKAVTEAEATEQWLTLCIDNDTYGIDVSLVQEVLNVPYITPVPGAPDYVIGIINLRGNVITVLDARKRFGLPAKQFTQDSQIIILRAGGQILGILVDSVSEVIELQVDRIDPASDGGVGSAKKHIRGVYSAGGYLLVLINTDCLVPQET